MKLLLTLFVFSVSLLFGVDSTTLTPQDSMCMVGGLTSGWDETQQICKTDNIAAWVGFVKGGALVWGLYKVFRDIIVFSEGHTYTFKVSDFSILVLFLIALKYNMVVSTIVSWFA